ncbi:hypothetical protein E3N88_14548 [Mikania micrantha]|uniref:Protein-lysine N-methyltransferase E3N88_14548 n=1 Tax=Mikania micrantha TaxID=192012 RepID=A0A5N6P308_9ASTR|nr:hypothetical protein E3N88_14548 [Mikania micrantha]
MEDVSKQNAGAVAGADEDDTPMLSAHALDALREFLSEQNRSLVSDNDGATDSEVKEVALVSEDWRLSQFWYDRDTAEAVASEVHALYTSMDAPPSVACIACPTLYVYLKKMHHDMPVQLLEYDKRFEQYGSEFTFYDYNEPLELPSSMKYSFSIIIADPPYLSQECLEKVSKTVGFLKKSGESYLLLLTGDGESRTTNDWRATIGRRWRIRDEQESARDGRKTIGDDRRPEEPQSAVEMNLFICTGAVQHDRAAQLLDLHPCGFRPQHSSKLGNEFRLYTNYDPGSRLGGWEQQ